VISPAFFVCDRNSRDLSDVHLATEFMELAMLYYALVFLVIALIAGVLGFGGIAGASAGIAQILFFLFLAFLVVSLVIGLFRRT
jgi:uncharacterized membrane protein YtjA (UPF0391 family)